MSRNDLNTSIATTLRGHELTVKEEVKSGNLASINITNPLKVDPENPARATGSISVAAAGEGSNLYLYITSGDHVWGIILGCPSNKENYFKYVYYGWAKAESDTYNACEGSKKYYANEGSVTFTPSTQSSAPGSQVTISITNVSPAAGSIQFAHY